MALNQLIQARDLAICWAALSEEALCRGEGNKPVGLADALPVSPMMSRRYADLMPVSPRLSAYGLPTICLYGAGADHIG
jgi:hypothetical protein